MRSRAITAMAVVQTAYTALIAVLAGYCVVLARAAAKSPKPDAGAAAHGLVVGAIFLGLVAVVYGIGAFGVWRVRLWGWWVSLLGYVSAVVLILSDIFLDHDRDPDNWIAIAILLGPTLFLCGVRRAFSRGLARMNEGLKV